MGFARNATRVELVATGSTSSIEPMMLVACDAMCKFSRKNCCDTSFLVSVPRSAGEKQASLTNVFACCLFVLSFAGCIKVACLSAAS